MKKLFLSLVIFSSLTFGTFAANQKGMSRGNDKSKMTELNLTSDQEAKIKSLKDEFKKKNEAIKNDTSLSADAKKEQRKKLREEQNKQFQTLLTPEQQAKMKEQKDKRLADRKQGRKDNARGGNKGNKFAKDLNLTADQKTKFEASNKSFKEKMQALRADTSLSKEVKAEKRKALMTSHKTEINSLLTPEQQTKMKDGRGKKAGDRKQGRKDMAKGGDKGNKFAEDLNLTVDQKTKFEASNKSFREKMQALRADTSLSKETKAEKRKALMTLHKTEINSLLTPEQQAKMKDGRGKKAGDKKHGRKEVAKSGEKSHKGNRANKLV